MVGIQENLLVRTGYSGKFFLCVFFVVVVFYKKDIVFLFVADVALSVFSITWICNCNYIEWVYSELVFGLICTSFHISRLILLNVL